MHSCVESVLKSGMPTPLAIRIESISVVVDRKMLAGDVYKLLRGTADAAFVVTVQGGFAPECGRRKVDWLCGSRSQLGCVRRGVGRSPSARLQTESFPTFDLEITTRSG